MRKTLSFFLFGAMLIGSCNQAFGEINSLKFLGVGDSELSTHLFKSVQKAGFEGDDVVVYRTDGTTKGHPFSDISKLVFAESESESSSAEDATIQVSDEIIITYDGTDKSLFVQSSRPIRSAVIVDVTGKARHSSAPEGCECRLSVGHFAAGIYALTVVTETEKKSIKFAVR